MKLYTVSEPIFGDGFVTPGIRIFPNDNPMGLRWGAVHQPDMKIVTVCRSQYRAVKAMVDSGKLASDQACHFTRADVTVGDRGLRFELEKDENDQRAFVYVRTSTVAADGSASRGAMPDDALPNTVTLTSNEYRHAVEGEGPRQRVRRVHQAFNEAVGVASLDNALLSDDGALWNEALLTLLPGSSFRVIRGGDIHDLVPEFLVTWTGHKLRTVVPERYRRRMEDSAVA